MYSTCLYCTRDLGHNDVVETLPVGRRVAFDAAEGRLWVICPACAKWNLVPFDTRLETIDTCERLFSDARLRYSTDNIGIARVREGLELVRIGSAQRPELAAWRYGDRFASRRRRNIAIAATVGVAGIGALFGVHALVGSFVGMQVPFQAVPQLWTNRRVATRIVPADDGEPLTLTFADIRKSVFVQRAGAGPEGWGISVPNRTGIKGRWFLTGSPLGAPRLLTGADATRALGAMLPVIAGTAGSRAQVQEAVGVLETEGTMERMVTLGRSRPAHGRQAAGTLGNLRVTWRLALEMLANEESERQWLQGELKLLERQWREADRLAAIADGLAISDEVAGDPRLTRRSS